MPFFEAHGIPLSRVLSDRGTENSTTTKPPQTNGICERFNKTCLNEFYRVAFRKKPCRSVEELQADLDVWMTSDNEERTHQGRWRCGKTPLRTFLDSVPVAKEKTLAS